MDTRFSDDVTAVFDRMHAVCRRLRNEFLMPEHLLGALLDERHFAETLEYFGCRKSVII